jgi:hypothetical protein
MHFIRTSYGFNDGLKKLVPGIKKCRISISKNVPELLYYAYIAALCSEILKHLFFFHVALQFSENLGHLLIRGFGAVFSSVVRTPWPGWGGGYRLVTRSLLTQDSTTQKDEDKHPCLERDSNPRIQYPSDQDHT